MACHAARRGLLPSQWICRLNVFAIPKVVKDGWLKTEFTSKSSRNFQNWIRICLMISWICITSYHKYLSTSSKEGSSSIRKKYFGLKLPKKYAAAKLTNSKILNRILDNTMLTNKSCRTIPFSFFIYDVEILFSNLGGALRWLRR